MEVGAQPEPNRVFDLELTLLVNEDGFTPVRQYDRFEYEGYEGAVLHRNGQPVYQDFRTYEADDLNGLLMIWGAKAKMT
jgi:hypothetical protein